jgi:threonine/homoserine/homoserine lactone efflux protein
LIPVETITIFLGASIALSVAPGPDNIFVLTQSALYGRAAGLLVTLGLCTGLLVHTAAVSLGVAAIFQTSALAFTLLKLAGAAYLLHLAFQAFRANSTDLANVGGETLNRGKLYSRGIIMNITNPKVAVFFLAFLPQFADPSAGPVSFQMMIFGGMFIATTLFVFGGIAWFSAYLGQWLQRSKTAQVIMNRVAGTIFGCLAIRLAVTER